MKKTIFIGLLFFTFICLNGQVIDFESGLPDDWSIDGGWKIGNFTSLGSKSLPFYGNDTKFVGTNDDQIGEQGHANGKIITSFIDFTNELNVLLQFDLYFFYGNYDGKGQETFDILYSEDGTNWTKITSVKDSYNWDRYYYDISLYVGGKKVKLAFEYKDGNNWNWGAGIDNISIAEQPDYFAIASPPIKTWAQLKFADDTAKFNIDIKYYGKLPLKNHKLVYSIDEGAERTIKGNKTLFSNDNYKFTIMGFSLGKHKLLSSFVMNDSTKIPITETNLLVVGEVPPFKSTDVNAIEHDILADLKSGKKVLLDFFASACDACENLVPALNEVWKNHGEGKNDFQIYSLTTNDGDDINILKGLNWGAEYPTFAFSPKNQMLWQVFNEKYGIGAIPFLVFICPNKENPDFSDVSWTSMSLGYGTTLKSEIENAISSCSVQNDIGVSFVEEIKKISKNTNEESKINILLKNTSLEEKKVYWKLEKPYFNHTWESQVCDINICYGNNKDQCLPNKPNVIKAGDTVLWSIHIFAHEIPDTAMIILKVYEDENFINLLDTLPILLNISSINSTLNLFVDNKISVSPNPSSDFVYVSFVLKKPMDIFMYITNIFGETIKVVDLENNIIDSYKSIDISDFEKGIYFINIKTNLGIFSKKIVKF